jgi:hypothetical protein
MTLALSIRQPWASLILLAGKDVENRSWPTYTRGPILIHAAQGMTKKEYEEAMGFAYQIAPHRISKLLFNGLLQADNLQRGGIIGSVNLVDCLRRSESPWFQGPNGFALRDPKPLPFIPFKGQLGFFEVPWGQP